MLNTSRNMVNTSVASKIELDRILGGNKTVNIDDNPNDSVGENTFRRIIGD